MSTLQNKNDFAVVIRVKNANPNGDPLNGNRPCTDYSNLGEMSDVSIKRKIRDRLLERWINDGKKEDDGNMIFVQSDDRKADDAKNLRERAKVVFTEDTSERWFDVRAFGQVFPFKGKGKNKKKSGEKDEAEGNGDNAQDFGRVFGFAFSADIFYLRDKRYLKPSLIIGGRQHERNPFHR